MNQEKLVLGEKWATKRPEELSPTDFIALTADLFGEELQPIRTSSSSSSTTTAAVAAGGDVGVGGASVSTPPNTVSNASAVGSVGAGEGTGTGGGDRSAYVSRPVWRKALFGASGSPTFGANPANTK